LNPIPYLHTWTAATDARSASRRVQALEAALRGKEEAEARAASEKEALMVG